MEIEKENTETHDKLISLLLNQNIEYKLIEV